MRVLPSGYRSVCACGVFVMAVLALSGCGSSGSAGPRPSKTDGRKSSPTSVTNPKLPPKGPPVSQDASQRMFAFYYLWWDTAHWKARLGPNYPYRTTPSPYRPRCPAMDAP